MLSKKSMLSLTISWIILMEVNNWRNEKVGRKVNLNTLAKNLKKPNI
jgi:hypothetical protein